MENPSSRDRTRRLTELRLICAIAAISMTALILFTRGVSLRHGMLYHADESVFYSGAASLADYVTGLSPVFTEEKEYPEGGAVFQMPVHLAVRAIGSLTGFAYEAHLASRIAGVIYYTAAALLGLVILRRNFSSSAASAAIYALTVVFSLIHIEQSRYGTGEPIIIFLLMLLVLCCSESMRGKRRLLLALSFFLCGALASVKYPLVYFVIFPVYAFAANKKGEKTGEKYSPLFGILCAAALAAGFMMFSPKAALDPMYIWRVSARELSTYFADSILNDVGGTWNHIVYALVYGFFYSGFPLMPLFFAAAAVRPKEYISSQDTGKLFSLVIPVGITVFFAYNLFVKLYFVRNIYPFFALADIYASAAAGKMLDKGGAKRAAVILLAAGMVLRGASFVWALSESEEEIIGNFAEKISLSVDEGWNRTTVIHPGFTVPFAWEEMPGVNERYLSSAGDYLKDEDYRIAPGELVIACDMDYAQGSPYFLPIASDGVKRLQHRWVTFNELNEAYCTGLAYPSYYYYLFGYWLKGTTGTHWEFPSSKLFYNPGS